MDRDREIEIAWAGGLFEGEGCITHKDKKKGCRFAIRMTDLDPLERFLLAVQVGSITGPYFPPNPKHKPFWIWGAGHKDDVLLVYSLLAPYLGFRRRAKFAEFKERLAKMGTRRQPNRTKVNKRTFAIAV